MLEGLTYCTVNYPVPTSYTVVLLSAISQILAAYALNFEMKQLC